MSAVPVCGLQSLANSPSKDFSVSLTFMAPMRWPWCRYSLQNGLDWGASHSLAAQPGKVSDRLNVPKMKGNSGHTSKANFGSDICEFESSMPSQPVRSPLFDFRLCENCRPSRGLDWSDGVSGRQILEFPVQTGGLAAPVSARRFPISVSPCPRPV